MQCFRISVYDAVIAKETDDVWIIFSNHVFEYYLLATVTTAPKLKSLSSSSFLRNLLIRSVACLRTTLLREFDPTAL